MLLFCLKMYTSNFTEHQVTKIYKCGVANVGGGGETFSPSPLDKFLYGFINNVTL